MRATASYRSSASRSSSKFAEVRWKLLDALARPMRTLISQHPRSLPVWLSVAIWLAVFLSPTGYFLLLMIANRSQVLAPPESIVALLFFLIPVVALLVCGRVAWLSKLNLRWRVGWLVLTILAMLLQFGVLFVIIVSAITAAIAPAQ